MMPLARGRSANVRRPRARSSRRDAMEIFTIRAIAKIFMEPFVERRVTRISRGRHLSKGDGVVSSPDELRSYAVDCARLARTATDPLDKARLLTMARAWTDLADRIEKIRDVGDRVAMDETNQAASPAMPQVPPSETAAPD